MKDTIKKLAIKKAKQSISKFKVSAIAFSKNGNIIAVTYNKPRFNRYGGGKHAEMEALKIGGNKIASMIICRVNQNGNILPIDPCSKCKKVLDKKGIKVTTVQ